MTGLPRRFLKFEFEVADTPEQAVVDQRDQHAADEAADQREHGHGEDIPKPIPPAPARSKRICGHQNSAAMITLTTANRSPRPTTPIGVSRYFITTAQPCYPASFAE